MLSANIKLNLIQQWGLCQFIIAFQKIYATVPDSKRSGIHFTVMQCTKLLGVKKISVIFSIEVVSAIPHQCLLTLMLNYQTILLATALLLTKIR